MSRETDESFMRLAIEASREAYLAGNMPFGAALVQEGAIVDICGNLQVTAALGEGDCIGHAEVVLVRQVSGDLGASALLGGTVYASGEPCAMCAGAMFWAGISRIVYAASTPDIVAAFGGASLPVRCADVLRSASRAVIVDGPVLGAEAVAVLREAAQRRGRS
jgi:tRNA(Arg) A34 adenosine deaminase TadA